MNPQIIAFKESVFKLKENLFSSSSFHCFVFLKFTAPFRSEQIENYFSSPGILTIEENNNLQFDLTNDELNINTDSHLLCIEHKDGILQCGYGKWVYSKDKSSATTNNYEANKIDYLKIWIEAKGDFKPIIEQTFDGKTVLLPKRDADFEL